MIGRAIEEEPTRSIQVPVGVPSGLRIEVFQRPEPQSVHLPLNCPADSILLELQRPAAPADAEAHRCSAGEVLYFGVESIRQGRPGDLLAERLVVGTIGFGVCRAGDLGDQSVLIVAPERDRLDARWQPIDRLRDAEGDRLITTVPLDLPEIGLVSHDRELSLWLRGLRALLEELRDEAHDVRLEVGVRTTDDELSDTPGPHALRVEEITPKDIEGFLGFRITEERRELGDHIVDARPVVPDHVVKVVGVLVLSSAFECERLENDERPGTTDPEFA